MLSCDCLGLGGVHFLRRKNTPSATPRKAIPPNTAPTTAPASILGDGDWEGLSGLFVEAGVVEDVDGEAPSREPADADVHQNFWNLLNGS